MNYDTFAVRYTAHFLYENFWIFPRKSTSATLSTNLWPYKQKHRKFNSSFCPYSCIHIHTKRVRLISVLSGESIQIGWMQIGWTKVCKKCKTDFNCTQFILICLMINRTWIVRRFTFWVFIRPFFPQIILNGWIEINHWDIIMSGCINLIINGQY